MHIGNTIFTQSLGPVALRGENEIERWATMVIPVEVHVRVDGPPGFGMQILGQMITQPVVDVQIQIKALAWYVIKLRSIKMHNLD